MSFANLCICYPIFDISAFLFLHAITLLSFRLIIPHFVLLCLAWQIFAPGALATPLSLSIVSALLYCCMPHRWDVLPYLPCLHSSFLLKARLLFPYLRPSCHALLYCCMSYRWDAVAFYCIFRIIAILIAHGKKQVSPKILIIIIIYHWNFSLVRV